MHKIVTVKVGSNVLTCDDGTLNHNRIKHLVEQIVLLREKGLSVVLISSGAVAAGKSKTSAKSLKDSVSSRQLWSSVGQVHLLNLYNQLFEAHQIECAQVLVTKQDFRSRQHYLNLKNCFDVLLNHNIIPIVNENDAISVTELMFTDNDELSGMVAAMTGSAKLCILTNVDGIYTGNPSHPDSELIKKVDDSSSDLKKYITLNKSNFGRGGMVTKYNIASKVAKEGIDVFIANGTRADILSNVCTGKEDRCTHFVAIQRASTVKKWIAHSDGFEKGAVVINDGAVDALYSEKATSLLCIGVVEVKGIFHKGDIIKIKTTQGKKIGLGRSMYNSETAQQKIGKKGEKPIVHYDYLYLHNR